MKKQRMYNFLWIIVCILCAVLNPRMTMQVKAADSIEITSQPSDITGVIGETITLSVNASGEDLQYSWLYNYEGEYGLDVSYLEVSEFNNTGNKATMKILLTDFLTWGVFWCRITDANGNQVDTQPCRITLNKNGSLPNSTELAGPSPEDGGGNVIWDCIWFGTYPQSEVTGSALTDAIKNADYNDLNDASVGNARYRRQECGDTYRYFLYEPIK